MRIEPDESRCELRESLRGRRQEVCRAVAERVHAIDVSGRDADLEYREGLRRAIEASVDFTIDASVTAGDLVEQVPAQVLSQARLAARRNVPLATVVHRYSAGHLVFSDFVVEEAGRQGALPGVLQMVLRSHAARTDQAIAMISATYIQEFETVRVRSPEMRRTEPIDTSDLAYDFDAWNLGIVLDGRSASNVTKLLERLYTGPRFTTQPRGISWVWLGGHRPLDPDRLAERLLAELPATAVLGVGEPGLGLSGWRLTHRQAQAALSVARARGDVVTRYAGAALLASTLQDDLLTTSLRLLILNRLKTDKNDGVTFRETLRAYFKARRNVSAAAAVLGVSRNTVATRLRSIEGLLVRTIDECGSELIIALRLEEIDARIAG